MKMSRAKLAELKKMGYYVESTDVDTIVVAEAKPVKPQEKLAAPVETKHTGPRKWKFDVIRDDFGFIESINANEVT